MPSNRTWLTALGLMLFALSVKIAITSWVLSHHDAWIIHLYTDIANFERSFFRPSLAGKIPYVDFTYEYPVGAGLLFWTMSFLIGHGDIWQVIRAHANFMLVFEVLNVGLFYLIAVSKQARRPCLLTLLFFLAPTGLILNSFRFEAAVTTLVLVGYWFHLQRKPLWATACWAVGSTMKWFPALFIFAQEYEALANNRRSQWMKSGAILLAVNLALNLPFVLYSYFTHGNIHMWTSVYQFHLHRPLYWDTLLGVWVLWMGYLPAERFASWWSLGLIAIAGFVKPKLAFEYRCVLLIIAGIICNRLYSTQFNLWFYPFLLFALDREVGSRFVQLLTGYIALDLVNVLVYPFAFAGAYSELGNFSASAAADRGGPWTVVFSVAIVLRAVLLIWLAVYVLRSHAEPAISSGKADDRSNPGRMPSLDVNQEHYAAPSLKHAP